MTTCIFLWGALLHCVLPGALADTNSFDRWWIAQGKQLYSEYAPPRHCHYETNISCPSVVAERKKGARRD